MRINVHSLRQGLQEFEFDATAESLGIEEGELDLKAVHIGSAVDKRGRDIVVTSHVVAQVVYECHRCLQEFVSSIEETCRTIYTTDYDAVSGDDEEVLELIRPNTTEIDLEHGVRESLLLAVPIRVVCSEQCKGLCPHCGANLNVTTCSCQSTSVDPRWKGLEKLLEQRTKE